MTATEDTASIHVTRWVRRMGVVTMVIDHIGFFLFPDVTVLRWIGRLAFPCFLYGVVEGVKRTRNPYRYAGRLALMGLVSILAWGRVFPINIGFSLSLLVLGLTAFRNNQYGRVIFYSGLSVFVEYGLYGFLYGLVLYATEQHHLNRKWGLTLALGLHLPILFGSWWASNAQVIALLFWVVLWGFKKTAHNSQWTGKSSTKPVPKIMGYGFYPIHIWLLRMVSGVV